MRSMTGYGRCRMETDGREMTIEMKTVNHRFLDIAFRLPKALSFAEDPLRRQVSSALCRGHVEISVSYQNGRADAREVRVDEALACQYGDALDRLRQLTHGDREGETVFIASQPDVLRLTVCEEDEDAVLTLLEKTVSAALAQVTAMREKEGAALKNDLSLHLNAVEKIRRQIAVLAPQVPKAYQERLQARLRELGVQEIDPQRLAQEVALMADRCAIDEELSRLESHIGQMREAIEADGEVGRRLDFLTQEMNREVNTIGSKASDAAITNLVVAAKSEIEKLREQVQNVE